MGFSAVGTFSVRRPLVSDQGATETLPFIHCPLSHAKCQFESLCSRRRGIGDVKLAVDLFQVVAHRVHADAQLVGDLFFYESFAQ